MPELTETPVLDLLASMTADSVEASSLDPEQVMLVRIAALVAMDAPPVSYLYNLGTAADFDVDADEVRGDPRCDRAHRGNGTRRVGDEQHRARARHRDRRR